MVELDFITSENFSHSSAVLRRWKTIFRMQEGNSVPIPNKGFVSKNENPFNSVRRQIIQLKNGHFTKACPNGQESLLIYEKEHIALLIIREMHIETTMKNYYKSFRMINLFKMLRLCWRLRTTATCTHFFALSRVTQLLCKTGSFLWS